MPQTRQLLNGNITYSVAKDKEANILHQLKYPEQKAEFFGLLESHRDWIQAIVAYHLNLPVNACRVADSGDWLSGSCNVCIPVTVSGLNPTSQPGNRVLIRFPLPYRIGEFSNPGNSDEKVRCEAGTYAWLEENCPDIPIPRLYGFGMGTGETFTRIEHLPLMSRWIECFHRTILRLLDYPVRSRYIRRWYSPGKDDIEISYLLIEYIEESQGRMLSSTWNFQSHNTQLRANFFRDLCKIYLSLSRVPLSKIGSFIIDNNGFLLLNNRPLSLQIQELENENIPVDIPQNWTYSTVESYVADILSFHDSRLRCQPNAINDMPDFLYQASCLATMRTVLPLFFQRRLRRGPFIFSLTDLHPSNIFVDENWHITSLVDLEYACSLPIELIQPPYWLTTLAVDRIVPEEYNKQRLEFMTILNEEEECCYSFDKGELRLSSIMGTAWNMGTFWYSLALTTPSGLFNIFRNQIKPCFIANRPEDNDPEETDHSLEFMPWYWARNLAAIYGRKEADKRAYDQQLQREFEG
ncbi:uncharacterized protein BJX67DRAFT_389567 [Aspergillus lucknowensis]|uniref:Aminoglycoside phosphotransferase domain-containing protein n=1 Tax=Aspergillus lucknowensis TaxID=176173 RepID=A0ABR4LKH5_9EURO